MSSATEDCCASPSLMSVDDALEKLLSQASALTETDTVRLEDALGRVLAEDVTSSIDVPGYDNSAMDGYAVRVADCAANGTRLKVNQRIPAGQTGTTLEAGCAARIFTGAPIPPDADAVIMQERCEAVDDEVVINDSVMAGKNIRRAGEDIKKNSTVLGRGTRLRHQELGMLASLGHGTVEVLRRLRVVVFFTGDELVAPGEELGPGQIYNSNRYTLVGMLQQLGCDVHDMGIVEDNLQATVNILKKATANADLVITSGGVSVGEEDHVRIALEQLGELSLWRIAMKPGKPVAFGAINNTLFLGLPGNPVSVFVTALIFARPMILKMQGVKDYAPVFMPARASFDWPAGKRCEYLRARVSVDGSDASVAIYPQQGSGVLSSACWADGLVEIPVGQVIKKGDQVRYVAYSSLLN